MKVDRQYLDIISHTEPSKLTEIKSSAIATAPTLSSQKTQRAHHNISELFIQTSRFFFPAVWVQLMKTLTVSPTQASDSAAC